jgi:hypothetical protein
MTKEEVIAFLQANLKDGGNRVGIEVTTDGDSGPQVGLYSKILYNYPHDHERLYGSTYAECPECEGSGIIGDDDDEERDCYECDGGGEIEVESDMDDASDVVVVNKISKEDILKMIDAMLD